MMDMMVWVDLPAGAVGVGDPGVSVIETFSSRHKNSIKKLLLLHNSLSSLLFFGWKKTCQDAWWRDKYVAKTWRWRNGDLVRFQKAPLLFWVISLCVCGMTSVRVEPATEEKGDKIRVIPSIFNGALQLSTFWKVGGPLKAPVRYWSYYMYFIYDVRFVFTVLGALCLKH